MNRSIITFPSNKRVFGACLLSFMTLMAPIASVAAATLRSTKPAASKKAAAADSVFSKGSKIKSAASGAANNSVAPQPVPLVASFTANKSDALVTDVDGDTKVDPGDTLEYTTVISNTSSLGENLTGMSFNDTLTDPNLIFANSVTVTPIAFNDGTYNLTGNTPITFNAAQGVLANDIDPNGPVPLTNTGLTAISVDNTGTQGTAVLNTDGSFTFTPATGFTGMTTWKYTAHDAEGLNSNVQGIVTMQVTGLVWYVDSAYAGANGASDGSYLKPFTSFTATNLNDSTLPLDGDVDGPNDTIFVYNTGGSVNYTTGVVLENTQTLIGDGEPLTVNGLSIGNSANDPTISNTNSNGVGVSLALGNTLKGFTVGDTGTSGNGTDISGADVGNLTITNVNLTGTGRLVNLATGAGLGSVNATFDAAATTLATLQGAVLSNLVGSVTFGSTPGAASIAGATGIGFQISGGTANVDFNGPISHTLNARAIDVQNKTSGTVSFDGAVSSTGTSDGINLQTNGTSIFSFTGMLTLTTSSSNSTGFNATGGGNVTATGTGSTISSGAGIGLNVANTNIGGTGLTFQNISTTNASNGIVLNNTGTAAGNGGLTVTGNGSTCTLATQTCDGGSIQTSTGAGISLTSTKAVSLTRMKIQNSGTDGIVTSGVSGFTLDNSIVTDSAGVVGNSGLEMVNTSGTLTISNSAVSSAPDYQISIDNNNTNMAAFNMTNTTAQCVVGNTCQPAGSVGNGALLVQMRGTSVLTTGNVQSCTFSGVRTTGVQVQSADTAIIASNDPTNANNFTVQTSTFTNNNIAMDFTVAQGSSQKFKVLNNTTITGHNSHAINVFSSATSTAAARIIGKLSGNTIGTQGTKDSGSRIGHAMRLVVQGASQGYIEADGNTIREVANADVFSIFGQESSVGSALFKITNNVLPLPSGSNQSLCGPPNTPCPGNAIFVLADTAKPVCTIITGNSVYDPSTLNNIGTNPFYLAERAGPPAGAQLTLQGNTGLSVETNITNNNTVTNDGPATNVVNEGGLASVVASCGFPTIAMLRYGSQPAEQCVASAELPPGGAAGSLVSFLDSKDFFASILERLNKATQSTEGWSSTEVVQSPPLSAVAAIAGENRSNNSPSLSHLLGGVTSTIAQFANRVDSMIVPTAHAESERTAVKDQRSEVRGRRSDVRLNHAKARSVKTNATSTSRVATAPAAFVPDVSIALGTLPANKSVTIKFRAQVRDPLAPPASSVSNQGQVQATGPVLINMNTNDPDTGAPNDATVTQLDVADLQLTKTDTPDPVNAGSNITYTLNYKNNGPEVANSVSLSDAVPANTTFFSVVTPAGWTRTDAVAVGGTGTLTFTRDADSANQETAVFTIVVKVNSDAVAASTINNSATVTSLKTDPDPANNTATASTTVQTRADLAVTKVDTPDPVTATNNITYTINFVNNGPSDAQTVTVTDAVPANTTFVSAAVATGTGWSIPSPPSVGGTGNVVFSKATVASGETASFTLVVNVNAGAADLSTITNNATAASATTDPTPGNNTGTATTGVNQSDIEITSKVDAPDPVSAGANITYTINFKNNSANLPASNVTVTDAVPANTTFVSAVVTTGTGWTPTDPGVGNTGNVVFSKATVAGAETAVFTIVVKVNSTVTAGTDVISNTATAATTSLDTNSGNNSKTALTSVQTRADLAVTKSDSPDPVAAGANITYTINLTNNGPSDAQTVTLTDAVPVNTTLVSVTNPGDWTRTDSVPGGGTGTIGFSKATVANAETAAFTIVVKVNSNTASATTITNTATVASATTDLVSGNNSATATTQVNTSADLQLTKGDSPDPVDEGTNLSYTLNFQNNGPSDAQTVTVSDPVPVNTTFFSVTTPGGWTRTDVVPVGGTGIISFSKASVVAAETAVFTIVVKVNTGLPNGTTITNTATTASATADSDSANNTAIATTSVRACVPPPANMANWWTGDDTARDIAGGKDGTLNGDDGVLDLEYSAGKVLNGFDFDGINDLVNVGDVDLANTFTIDAWVNPTDLSIDRAIVSKDDGAAQRSYFFHITSAGALQASVNSTGGFTVYQTADGVITAGSFQHVAVTYDDSAGAGAKMLFYKNGVLVPSTVQGGQDAGGVPENNSLAALIGRSATTNNTFLGVIDEVEIFSRVLSGAELTTIFTADGGGKCKPSDLKITKSHTDPFVQGSTANTYTITVHNDGPATTSGTTTMTENVPAGLTATSMSGLGWTCLGSYPATGPAVRTCTSTDAIASGADFPVITLTVDAGVNVASVDNIVTVSGGGEMDTSDDSFTDTTNLTPSADLEITFKTDAPDPVLASQNITYTINFINNGPSEAQTVTVTDAVPAGTTFVSASFPAGWGRTDSVSMGGTGNVVFAKSPVAAAETATFTMVVQVNANAVEGSSISNTATAAGAFSDPVPGNNSKTATTLVNQSDIEITSKTDLPDPVDAGSNITYTVNFKNNSAVNPASNVTVTDAVPVGTTFVSATSPAGWSPVTPAVGGTGNIVFSKALVAGSETAVFTIVVNVNSSVANATVITNTATAATSSLDTVSLNNSASTNTTVQVNADLQITSKTDLPDPVTASQNITYAINFANNGPSDAQGVTITDAVPTGTTFVSAQVTTGTGWTIPSPPAVGGTGNVVFAKTTVAAGESAVFEVVVKVDNNAVEGSIITNNAVAAGTTNDPTPGNNTGTATTTVYQSDIEITSKTDAPDPVTAGQNLTYTVNFKNNSAFNPASNVTVTDAIPTGTTLVSATPAPGWLRTDAVPVGGTGNIVFSKSPVSVSETAVFTIVVNVNSSVANATVITNTATAATTSIDTNSANDSASTTTTVQVVADLEITSKTDTPDPVIASQNITYTINFANNGPSDAQTVTVTDAVPANTTLVSATFPAGWGRTDSVPVGGTGNIVFAKATVPAGETASFTIVVQVNANAVEGSSISNTATAAGAVTDNTPANDSKTTTTAVNQSDIEITSKTDTPDPVTAGQDITYTVNFKNNSANTTASNVTVTDVVPVGTTFVSVTAPGTWTASYPPPGSSGTIVLGKALVAVSETAVFTIVVKVNSSVANGTVITNTATAATSSIDTNSANNAASATTTVEVVADLEITAKTDTPDPVIASQNITYTVNFANNGPSDAQTVTVTDAVPANTTLVSATTASPGWARSDAVAAGGTGNIVFAKATVPAGETASFTIVVQVNANAVEGSTITNTATAAGAVTDNTPANDSKTTTTTVNQSDIEITSKTDTPDPVTAGNNITYTVNFKNNSAFSTASNVTVTDAVPAGTTLISATTVSPGWARTDAVLVGGTGNIVFSKALVAVSETAVFTIVVKVGASATTTVTNTATAATTSIDTNSANNSASATTTVNTIADLEITAKTDAPDPVIAGNNLTYTINLVNNGPSDAQTVTVTDAVPANTTFVSATLPAGWSRSDAVAAGGTGNLIFAKATVAAAETATFTVVVKVNASTAVGTVLSNTATAASATTDNTPGNNAKTATTTVSTSADLLVVKVNTPDPVIAGDNLTYTITVTNNGVSDAQSVQLSDTLPASTTLVSFTVPGGWTRTDVVPVGGTGTVTATTPTLAVGASAQFTLVVNVNASTPHNTVLTNSATVSSTTNDPNPSNNTGTATTTVLSQPDLTITKTHSGNFSGGQVGATYTITVNNIGTGPTTAPVTVTDTVPVGLTPTGPNGVVNGWTCSINGQTLTCTRSDVLSGGSSYPPINLTVNVANPAPLNVVNTATVSGGGEVNTANNTASDPTTINCSADFGLNNTSPLMISRFRQNGPAGPQDEFVEIYNPSPIAHTVASGNCNGGGYGVYASAGNGTTSNTATLVCYIPNGTVIPAGGYYLCTGVTYSLGNLGLNGGAAGATATGDAPIGCGGTCGTNIPDDAGLVLTNKAEPTVTTPENFGLVEFGEVIYDKVGFGFYGPAAPAPGYPTLASVYCEGGAAGCLQPVGDASTGAPCTNPSGQFPVVSVPPACYGLAGQYEFLRRQTTFSATEGTIHQDTNNSGNDFILVAPNPATNMGTAVTGVTGVTAVLGAARPYNRQAPPDMPAVKLTRTPFDGPDQLGPRNAERRFIPDPTIVDLANNPLGTFVLRFKYTNNSGSPINVIRFETDNLSTLCGPQVAAPTTASVGTGDARNLSSTPGCGTGTFTAIFKALNSTSEIVVDGGGTAQFVNGTVMEDLSVGAAPGAGPLSPKGGGIDSTYIINPSSNAATVGDGVTGGVGNFGTVIGTTDPTKVLRVRVKFGVVRSGRFILLLVPMAKNSPAP